MCVAVADGQTVDGVSVGNDFKYIEAQCPNPHFRFQSYIPVGRTAEVEMLAKL